MGLPLGGAGGVDAGAERVDGDGDGHVDDIELVDGLHAEVGEGEDAGGLDGLGDEVDGLKLADRGDGFRAALGVADGAEQTGLGEYLAGELVHAGRSGGADWVGQCCVLGRAVRIGSHSPHRCVNASAFQVSNPAQNDLRARRKLVLPERRPQGQAQ